MSEETQAAPSPAAVVEAPVESTQSFDIPRSNTPEYQEWRKTGEIPKPKTEAPAPSDAPKETTTDDAADSAATKTQESRRRPDVEDRFKKLTETHKAEMDSLRRELDELRRPKETKAESSPAKPAQPQTYKEWREAFDPDKWVEQYGKDNPTHSYERANAAMADHLGDVREQFRSIEEQRSSQAKAFNDEVEKARSKYPKFDEVVSPFATAVNTDPQVAPVVKQMLLDSEVLSDVLYAIGSNEADSAKFMKMAKENPGKALRYLAVMENGIIEALAKGTNGTQTEATNRNEKGQFTKPAETPAKRGPESAPEPPIEIGSRGTSTLNESDRAFQAIERGDAKAFRAWKDAENAKDLRRRRGA